MQINLNEKLWIEISLNILYSQTKLSYIIFNVINCSYYLCSLFILINKRTLSKNIYRQYKYDIILWKIVILSKYWTIKNLKINYNIKAVNVFEFQLSFYFLNEDNPLFISNHRLSKYRSKSRNILVFLWRVIVVLFLWKLF